MTALRLTAFERRLHQYAAPIVLLAMLTNGIVGYLQITHLAQLNGHVVHTHEVLSRLQEELASVSEAEAAVRGYVIFGEAAYLEPYQEALHNFDAMSNELPRLIADNTTQKLRGTRLRKMQGEARRAWRDVIDIRNAAGREVARDQLRHRDTNGSLDSIAELIGDMEAEELQLLAHRRQSADNAEWYARATLSVGTIIGITLVVSLSASIRREARAGEAHAAELRQVNGQLEQLVEARTVALRATNYDLARSNQELERFASVASHDLQEPLRKVQAFADRLQDKFHDVLGGTGQEYLSRMLHSTARMRRLIDDLLSYSRITTKAQPFVSVDLNRIVTDVLVDLEHRAEETGATINSSPLPTIDADPLQMRQLLQNLLSNSMKFHLPQVPPVITIRGDVRSNGGNGQHRTLELTVQDNGIGFDEIYAERIFEVFQRLHGRSEYEGTGMGLAICRRIVERHRGTIIARSAVNQGTRFIITLPLKHAEGCNA